MRRIAVSWLACLAAGAAYRLAPTPPMGWNSWDSRCTSVTEAEVRAKMPNIRGTREDLPLLGLCSGAFRKTPQAVVPVLLKSTSVG
jgi:hypothetical protein